MSWTWQGRQLVTAEKDGTTLNYTYDSEGIRTSKSDGTNTTKYLLNGTQILAQTTNGKTLCFFYDQQGNRVGMADSGNHFYYYLYNLQGDVIALADASTGKLAVTYTYDAWGKIVKINGQKPEDVASTNIANINPFRYRGYYYDTETNLYYLQTRYYDPEVGRFINADAFASTDISSPLSANMFAYCENRPTVGSDPTGEWVHIAVGAVVGGIMGGIQAGISNGNIVSGIATGALGGALAMSGAGWAAQIMGSAALSAADSVVSQLTSKSGSSFSVETFLEDTVSGAISGAIGGKGASITNAKSIMGYGKQMVKQVKNSIKYGGSILKPINNYLGRAHVKGGKSVFREYAKSSALSTLYTTARNLYNRFFRNR